MGANRGGRHDGQGDAKRLGRQQDPRGLDRPGGDARDHRSPLERSARRRRVPGGRQRAGGGDAGDAPPRSEQVLPFLLPLERGGLDTLGGGRGAVGAASYEFLLGGTLFTQGRGMRVPGRLLISSSSSVSGSV